ncbi:MAG: cytochrome c [Chloroflexia bacterium]|nr:cytochrome c [Chloroflexia bacterium]
MFKTIRYLFGLGIIALVLSSCAHDRNTPGYQYFDDMVVSSAYETDSENPFFKDGKTNQSPVEGTIARGQIPYAYKAMSADEQTRAGVELKNPIAKTEESLKQGKAQFDIYCVICHGTGGKGDGTIVANGKFTAKPIDLTSDRVQNFADGEIFHIITTGSVSGLMGAHGPQIKVDNRWMIVDYIKNGLSTKVK